ncbi:hypothetical protein Lesp02_41370 [Lentzea sp. NBRC 105346]|uniref:nSTAND1 domain-containing NTPase n=1 Tax=Lentzea sp. NBRC 105346 TaxID=3032205 RepID=UPI0024A57D1D|nr:XRE family transcriptional regulator [Lentzea sp. NBRC 105346]GLZ31949.1 hypothetical protein Lesp02_41370 [Lentzea sp. NBRC 105346]
MPRSERPLPNDGTPLSGFATDLRSLRQRAGGPPYRELGRRAGYSAATLSEAAGGKRLPSLDVTLAFVRACDGDTDEWENRWHAIAAGASPAPAVDHAPAPYTGLAPFGPGDADRFFGRERLTEDLLARKESLITVFGASGSGKSSLLRAGLAPRLRGRVVVVTPGDRPFERCAQQIARVSGLPQAQLDDPRDLHLLLRQAAIDRGVVLIVDQFEEVFTLCGEEERGRFIAALAAAATGNVRVVLGVRADFFAHCSMYAELVESAHVTVGPMSPDELRRAITKPALGAGGKVENALLAHLVAQVHGSAGVLPLLSHALLETWRRRQGTMMTLAGFHASGGIDGALAKTAESVYGEFDVRQRLLARNLFRRLTAPGDGTEDTKRRIGIDELDDDPDLAVVLDRLTSARLLVRDQDGVEITHEALIRAWPRLTEWLNADRDGLRVHRQLTEAARQWESLGRDPSLLFRGTRLAVARECETGLNASEQAFLDASLTEQQADEAWARRRTRRLRQLIALLNVVVALLAVAVFVAVDAQRMAERERNVAVARKAIQDADLLRGDDPRLAARVALAAYRLAPSPEARNGLVNAHATHSRFQDGPSLPVPGPLPGVPAPSPALPADAVHPDHKLFSLTGTYPVVVRGADERRIVTAGDDVRLWDATCEMPCEIGRIEGKADAVALRPDNRVLAVSSGRSTRLWDIEDPRNPKQLKVFLYDAQWAVFNRDGSVLATGSETSPVSLWDMASPAEPRRVAVVGLSTGDNGGAFGPTGLFATTNPDGTLSLWDTKDPTRVRNLMTVNRNPGRYHAPSFSKDGHVLGALNGDRSATVWRVEDDKLLDAPLEAASAADMSMLTFPADGTVRGYGRGTATTWTPDVSKVAEEVCRAGPLDAEQWKRFFPGVPRQTECR